MVTVPTAARTNPNAQVGPAGFRGSNIGTTNSTMATNKANRDEGSAVLVPARAKPIAVGFVVHTLTILPGSCRASADDPTTSSHRSRNAIGRRLLDFLFPWND